MIRHAAYGPPCIGCKRRPTQSALQRCSECLLLSYPNTLSVASAGYTINANFNSNRIHLHEKLASSTTTTLTIHPDGRVEQLAEFLSSAPPQKRPWWKVWERYS